MFLCFSCIFNVLFPISSLLFIYVFICLLLFFLVSIYFIFDMYFMFELICLVDRCFISMFLL
jgi:hypothetical protein